MSQTAISFNIFSNKYPEKVENSNQFLETKDNNNDNQANKTINDNNLQTTVKVDKVDKGDKGEGNKISPKLIEARFTAEKEDNRIFSK